MKKLIVFLVRRRLGLKKGEHFKFANQASPYNTYYFTDDAVMKRCRTYGHWGEEKSRVSLNWLLDDECKIVKVENGNRK